MTIIPMIIPRMIARMIATEKSMKKLAITRKLMIAILSKQGERTGASEAAGPAAAPRLEVQPMREFLLQICCRCNEL